jgi:hypothetical protein
MIEADRMIRTLAAKGKPVWKTALKITDKRARRMRNDQRVAIIRTKHPNRVADDPDDAAAVALCRAVALVDAHGPFCECGRAECDEHRQRANGI